jgi:hypothetical protein
VLVDGFDLVIGEVWGRERTVSAARPRTAALLVERFTGVTVGRGLGLERALRARLALRGLAVQWVG